MSSIVQLATRIDAAKMSEAGWLGPSFDSEYIYYLIPGPLFATPSGQSINF